MECFNTGMRKLRLRLIKSLAHDHKDIKQIGAAIHQRTSSVTLMWLSPTLTHVMARWTSASSCKQKSDKSLYIRMRHLGTFPLS